MLIYMPDGGQDLFTADGSGGYNRPYKNHNTLTKLGTNHFELRFPKDTVYIFQIPAGTSAAYPMLVEKRNTRGQALVLGYNAAALLTTITDALGQATTLTYTGDKVTRAADPFGRHAAFEYDGNGDLTRITDMGGYWTDMTYAADSYIASMQDDRSTTGFYIEPRDASVSPSGTRTRFEYDANGNQVKLIDANNQATTFDYDLDNRLVKKTYADGRSIYFQYNAIGKLSRRIDETRLIRNGLLVLQERGASNAVIREYTWGANRGGGIGGQLNLRSAGQDYNSLYDAKGNVSAVNA